jgi:hypothetical protein
MKTLVKTSPLLLVVSAAPALAGGRLICPTLPGTSIRDYGKACLKIE